METDIPDTSFEIQVVKVLANDSTLVLNAKRSNAELDRLYQFLQANHPDLIIPVPPAASLEHERYGQVGEEFLRKIMSHPVLRESTGARLFFDSEFQVAIPSSVSSPSQRKKSSFMLFSTSTRVPEVDVYFEQARMEVGKAENALAPMIKAVEKLHRSEKAFAVAIAEVAFCLSGASKVEPPTISGAFKKVSKVMQTIDLLHSGQSLYTSGNVLEQMSMCAKSNQSAQSALDYRLNLLTEYDTCCKTTQKKVQAIEKLKASSSIRQDKVEVALEELKEAKTAEGEKRDALKQVSDTVRSEYTSFSRSQGTELQVILNDYVKRQLLHSKQMMLALNSERL
ncbi:Vacuolar protein sorting-associated protein 17 [Blyttiomyces sp. JEL0837]|nr:Vacuolar protein sorting-associated protein 17 [Blyttiomyces sp. JEL0837]